MACVPFDRLAVFCLRAEREKSRGEGRGYSAEFHCLIAQSSKSAQLFRLVGRGGAT